MNIFRNLSSLVLRELVLAASKQAGGALGEQAAKSLMDFVRDRVTDNSQRLIKALKHAHESAWRALELALADENTWNRIRRACAPGDEQAVSRQMRAFLAANPVPERSRDACRANLEKARAAGLLSCKALDQDALIEEMDVITSLDTPLTLVEAELRALEHTAEELRNHECEDLADLLQIRRRGAPLLVAAARFFFRQAIAKDAELSRDLTFTQLEKLDRDQTQRFVALSIFLERQGSHVNAVLGSIEETVTDTNDRVRRLEREVQRLVEVILGDRGLRNGILRPAHSFSIRDDMERGLVKDLIAKYRQLPEELRKGQPLLQLQIGKAEVVAGELAKAREHFDQVVANTDDGPTKAEGALLQLSCGPRAAGLASGARRVEGGDVP